VNGCELLGGSRVTAGFEEVLLFFSCPPFWHFHPVSAHTPPHPNPMSEKRIRGSEFAANYEWLAEVKLGRSETCLFILLVNSRLPEFKFFG